MEPLDAIALTRFTISFGNSTGDPMRAFRNDSVCTGSATDQAGIGGELGNSLTTEINNLVAQGTRVPTVLSGSGLQQINVREVGLIRDVHDIENTVIVTKGGTPLRVKDIAVVSQGPKIRLGRIGKAVPVDHGVGPAGAGEAQGEVALQVPPQISAAVE